MTVKLLAEHHLKFLSLKGGCRGSSESKLVKMLNCWKSHAGDQLLISLYLDGDVEHEKSFITSCLGYACRWLRSVHATFLVIFPRFCSG